jgi:PAS domain S-box-containing protein
MDEVGVEGDAFRLIFDVNPRPMLVFDRETLELLTINEAACALYGWSRDELLAMTIREIRRSEDVPDLDFALAHERRHSKQSFARYSRHVTKDGRELDVRVELTRILFRGRPSVLAVITDLTGTADVERRFRILVEHSAEGICVVDENGAFVYLSPGAERIVGVQSGELVGVSSSWLVHPDDLAGLKPPADGETVFDVYRGRRRISSVTPVCVRTSRTFATSPTV